MARQVADPALRAKLTPTYTPGCKRLLQSNDYYPALQRPNVTLETEKIIEVQPDGVVTADGVLHEVDTIIYGTGFRITSNPMAEKIHGADGRSLQRALGPHGDAGLLRHHDPGIPQLLHAGRTEHGDRPHLPRGHDRSPIGACRRCPPCPHGRRGERHRRARRDAGALERRSTAQSRTHGVEFRWMLELVPR